MEQTLPPQQPPQKLIDFNEELKSLCAKYQYEIRPVFQFDAVRGVFAILQAFDVSPKDEGVPLAPEGDQSQVVEPAQPVEPETPAEAPVDEVVEETVEVQPVAPDTNPAVDNSEVN